MHCTNCMQLKFLLLLGNKSQLALYIQDKNTGMQSYANEDAWSFKYHSLLLITVGRPQVKQESSPDFIFTLKIEPRKQEPQLKGKELQGTCAGGQKKITLISSLNLYHHSCDMSKYSQ